MKLISFIILIFGISCVFQGIDVSTYQNNIDWTTVAQNNHFAIIRAGYGFGHIDDYYETNYQKATLAAEVKLPDDETLKEKWALLGEQYHRVRPRLASALSNARIAIREEDGRKIVDFFVVNESQKQWIEEKMLRDLETNLRQLTLCPKVNVVVSVVPEEEQKKVPYMPEEKARDLMDRNPAVRDFVAELGLDTK